MTPQRVKQKRLRVLNANSVELGSLLHDNIVQSAAGFNKVWQLIFRKPWQIRLWISQFCNYEYTIAYLRRP